MPVTSPYGLHRVLEPTGASITLPQTATRLDDDPRIGDDEVRIDVEVLNLDAASYRQLADRHRAVNEGDEAAVSLDADGGVDRAGDRQVDDGVVDGAAVRSEVLEIVRARGKMQNPVTGSGGMLIGTVAEAGPRSPLGLSVGDRVATLVSLSLTPLRITDGLARWDGLGERVPTAGHAILFGRSIAARLPDDIDPELALMVMDVCGAPALVSRVVGQYSSGHDASGQYAERTGQAPTVLVLGGSGKSGSLSLAAAALAGAGRRIAVVPHETEAAMLRGTALADEVVVADARAPLALHDAVLAAGGPADVTVVCVDVPGCEQPAILATAQGGTVIFFSMATQFAAAALGAEGLAADVTMLIGNGFVPGHADYALSLLRDDADVRALFEARRGEQHTRSS